MTNDMTNEMNNEVRSHSVGDGVNPIAGPRRLRGKRSIVRNISASIAALSLLALSACSAASDGGDNASSPGDGDDSMTVAFVNQIIGIPYFTAMKEGGEAAAKDLGITYIDQGPTNASAPDQLNIFNSLVAQGVDAISVSVLDADTIDNAISQARSAGIQVITSDSDAPNSERQLFVSQASDQMLGYVLADELAREIGEEGKVGIVTGAATATNLASWVKFMTERWEAEYPNIEVLPVQNAESTDDTIQATGALISANPDIKGIVGVSSSNVPGVAQAVINADKIGEIAVTGYGSPATVAPYIEQGVIQTSILWDPVKLGYLNVWAMHQLATGETLSASNDVPGFDQPVEFDEATGTLLLGDPLVITEDNYQDFAF